MDVSHELFIPVLYPERDRAAFPCLTRELAGWDQLTGACFSRTAREFPPSSKQIIISPVHAKPSAHGPGALVCDRLKPCLVCRAPTQVNWTLPQGLPVLDIVIFASDLHGR
jgi:hypothetical protein